MDQNYGNVAGVMSNETGRINRTLLLDRITRSLFGVLFGAFIALMIWGVVEVATRQTTVMYRIWPSGVCVKIEPPDRGTCDRTPRTYETNWVSTDYTP